MIQTQRQAVLLSLIRNLREVGSWCGETHIQKAVYFLQEACGVPLGFNFILYKHGPYLSDLSDELTALQADNLLRVVPEREFGSHLYPTATADEFLSRFPRTVARFAAAIEYTAQQLGQKKVVDLERAATAMYVIREQPEETVEHQVARIQQLKPHVTHSDAVAAIEFVRNFQVPSPAAS